MSFLLVAAVVGVAVVFYALSLVRQFRLAREGVVTRARVKRRLRPLGSLKGPLSNVIKYDFLTPRGEYVEQTVFVGEVVSQLHKEGSEIEIVYLRDKPSVSGIKERVNRSRKVMNLPPL